MNDSIFVPNYTITPTISSALESIDRQRWLIDNMLLMPKHEAWIRREVQVKRASGTTQIEGANLDEAAVTKLINRSSRGRLTEDEQANINALDAYRFIDYLSDQRDIPIDELVIRQLNRYFINGALETLTPGAYRKGQNKVGNFTPPDQGDVPALMRSFALWLRQEDDEIHPVIKAGIAHIHLIAIHPFWDGNGRTARGLSTLILQRSQYGFRKLLSLELNMSQNRDSYFTAIERTLSTSFSLEYNATPWLEFFTLMLGWYVAEFVAALTDWHRWLQVGYTLAATEGLKQRQAEACVYARQAGQITRSDYMEIAGVSAATASRDLAELVKAGWLITEGKTRSRIYRLAHLESKPQRKPAEEQLPLLPDP
jgi:Fic family protein